jgi:hypothetical protein
MKHLVQFEVETPDSIPDLVMTVPYAINDLFRVSQIKIGEIKISDVRKKPERKS